MEDVILKVALKRIKNEIINYLKRKHKITTENGKLGIYLSENKEGEVGPTLIGNVPDLDEDVSIQALDAAVNAFSRGQGKWPTMKAKKHMNDSAN